MSELVFVTGASGYLAGRIIDELVAQGYSVRASARGNKVDQLRELYKGIPSVEIVRIDDIAQGDIKDVLRGSHAVIHTASPLAGFEDKHVMFRTAIEGSLNVVRQAYEVGVKKFVVTSSISAVTGDYAPRRYNWDDWNPVTEETASNPYTIYEAAKKYAELAVWVWAKEHPDTDVTTFTPPLLYGPSSPVSIKPSLPGRPSDYKVLGTNLFVYQLIHKSGNYPFTPAYADVRDVAKAHVGALRTTSGASASTPESRRIVFSSPHGLDFKALSKEILDTRPDLKGRWTKNPPPTFPGDRYEVDFERITQVTGLRKEEFHRISQTFLDAIDYLLTLEGQWKEEGYVVPESLPQV